MSNERPTWEQVWMRVAYTMASRSIDNRRKVGAIIVTSDNTRVLSVGYNGDHKGGPNKVDSSEEGMSGFIHAEENAIIKMNYNEHREKTMYVTTSPCLMCAKKIINADIKTVVYCEEYRKTDGIELLKKYGVSVKRVFFPDI